MKSFAKVTVQAIAMLCLLVGIISSTQVQAEDFNPSWSLDYAVEPSQKQIAGEPLLQLDAELTHIEFINCEHESLSNEQCRQIAELGGELEMKLDMNQDGCFEVLRIAVAKLRNDEYAKVLVIQDEMTHKVIQTLIVESEIPGFSALYFQEGQVMWGMCLSCDVLADIEWSQGEYHMNWKPAQSEILDDEIIVENYTATINAWK
jgi:hypothetical protein